MLIIPSNIVTQITKKVIIVYILSLPSQELSFEIISTTLFIIYTNERDEHTRTRFAILFFQFFYVITGWFSNIKRTRKI